MWSNKYIMLVWYGHVRRDEIQVASRVLVNWCGLTNGKGRGRPMKRWIDVWDDVSKKGVGAKITADRGKWKNRAGNVFSIPHWR